MSLKAALALVLLSGGCGARTELRVEVVLATGELPPAGLEASIFGSHGALVRARPLTGAALPGRLDVLLPSVAQTIRVVIRGTPPQQGLMGGVRADVQPGRVTSAGLALGSSTLDQDGDGVPDVIDDCPDTADPEQLDGDGDGIGDACAPVGGDLAVPDAEGADDLAASDAGGGDLAAADLAAANLATGDGGVIVFPGFGGGGASSPFACSAGCLLDDFAGPTLSPARWQSSLPPGWQLTVGGGALEMDGPPSSQNTLTAKFWLEGDFSLTVDFDWTNQSTPGPEFGGIGPPPDGGGQGLPTAVVDVDNVPGQAPTPDESFYLNAVGPTYTGAPTAGKMKLSRAGLSVCLAGPSHSSCVSNPGFGGRVRIVLGTSGSCGGSCGTVAMITWRSLFLSSGVLVDAP